jgi:hypothetical protein
MTKIEKTNVAILSKSCRKVVKKLLKILKRVGGGGEEERDL